MASRWNRREALAGYAFLLPNFIGFLLFTSLPVVASLALAFTKWDLLSSPEFVGLANFKSLLGWHAAEAGAGFGANDPRFWYYCFNTIYLMAGIPVGMIVSLGLAVALNQKLRGVVFFRTIYFMPTLSAGVALYILWRWIYDGDFGLLNMLLGALGVAGPEYLLEVAWARPALIFMGLWIGAGGFNMVLYLAGLQGIDPALYEAAAIDGASPWQKFRAITWPMLSPTTFFIFIMSVIAGFQAGFDQAYVMTKGGPFESTMTISYYIYKLAFAWNHMGMAAAVSWVLFLAILIATLFNWRQGGRLVHY